MTQTLITLHPGVEAGRRAAPRLAPRLASLAGKRVALLDNGKPNAGAMISAVAARLQARGAGEVRTWRKQHASAGGDQHFPELLQWKPDLVLTAMGD